MARAYFQSQDHRRALQSQESAHRLLQATLPENSPYIKQAKDQLDYFFRFSVQAEKMKTVKSQQTNEELIAAIQAAYKKNKGAEAGSEEPVMLTAEQVEKIRQEHQQKQAVNAYQKRYKKLEERVNDPKRRTHLDVLEYQHMKDQQTAAQRNMYETFTRQAQDRAAREAESKK